MKKTIKKNAVLIEITIIRILAVVLQLVFLKLYVKYTSTDELGVYIFLVTVSYSLNAFLLVPLDFFQQSQLYKLKNNGFSLKSFLGVNLFVLKVTGGIVLVAIVIVYFINPAFCYKIPLIALMAISVYLVNLIRGIINNLEHRRQAAICVPVEFICKILFFLLLVKIFKVSSSIILFGSVLLGSLSILIVLLVLCTRLPEYKTANIYTFKRKEIVSFAYPISIGAVINWLQIQGYSLILVPLGLKGIVGTYSTVSNIGVGGMGACSTIYGQMFLPNLYKSEGFYIRTYVRNALVMIVAVVLGGYILSGFLVDLLTKHEFVKYSTVIVYGVLIEGGNLLIGALSICLTIYNRTALGLKVSITSFFIFAASFFVLLFLHKISIFTIGLPIVVTQVFVVLYMMVIAAGVMRDNTTLKVKL